MDTHDKVGHTQEQTAQRGQCEHLGGGQCEPHVLSPSTKKIKPSSPHGHA
jgi:hypothetical protein